MSKMKENKQREKEERSLNCATAYASETLLWRLGKEWRNVRGARRAPSGLGADRGLMISLSRRRALLAFTMCMRCPLMRFAVSLALPGVGCDQAFIAALCAFSCFFRTVFRALHPLARTCVSQSHFFPRVFWCLSLKVARSKVRLLTSLTAV